MKLQTLSMVYQHLLSVVSVDYSMISLSFSFSSSTLVVKSPIKRYWSVLFSLIASKISSQKFSIILKKSIMSHFLSLIFSSISINLPSVLMVRSKLRWFPLFGSLFHSGYSVHPLILSVYTAAVVSGIRSVGKFGGMNVGLSGHTGQTCCQGLGNRKKQNIKQFSNDVPFDALSNKHFQEIES